MYGYIYLIENSINTKIYVGKHHYEKEGLDKYYFCSGVLVNKAINKYGIDKFSNKIIDVADSLEELNLKEKFWIKELKAKAPNSYNLTDGGDGLCNPTDEVRYKCGSAWRGKKVPRPIVEIRNASLRKPHYPEWNANISKSLKGKSPSPEVIEASRLVKTGTHWYTNSIDDECQYKEGKQPEGWVRGRLVDVFEESRHKPKSKEFCDNARERFSKCEWFSNGIESMFVNPCEVEIPEGFVRNRRGPTKEYSNGHVTNAGKSCYTSNGKDRKYIADGDEVPEGYILSKDFTAYKKLWNLLVNIMILSMNYS